MKNNQEISTKEQLNKLSAFRQLVYENGLEQARDAQFELIDAILASDNIRSFAELSLSPLHRRTWSSAYAAIENGQQDSDYLRRLFMHHLPNERVQVFALDASKWIHADARTLSGLVLGPTTSKLNIQPVHVYSMLAYIPQTEGSWAVPISTDRLHPQDTEVQLGIRQVQQLCDCSPRDPLRVIVADGGYGNHLFLKGLKELPCAAVVRLRRDRVLYGEAVYSGKGRPPVHGKRFAFKEPDTWTVPNEDVTFEHPLHGQVRVRSWKQLHAQQDSTVPFTAIRCEIHLERDKPPDALWIAYDGPSHVTACTIWQWYNVRQIIEPAFRFRKQHLFWTRPQFQDSQRCDRWTLLVDIAYWMVWLARHLVQDCPLPWQKSLATLTPGRILRGMASLFTQIGTPACDPQTRGNPSGWTKGRQRTRPKRYSVVKRGKKRLRSA
jgi:hypothetical protein